jgi:hypothetical protein
LKLPRGIGTQIPIQVTVANETSAVNTMFSYSGNFFFFFENIKFTILAAPNISSTALSADTDGGTITIQGENFVPSGVNPGKASFSELIN